MENGSYCTSTKVMHWVTALALVSIATLGFCMVYAPPADSSAKLLMFKIHKACGMLVLGAMPFRIALRILFKAPPYSEKFSNLSVMLARIGHIFLYILMVCIPLSGYVMSSAAGRPVSMLFFTIPALIPQSQWLAKVFSYVHETLVFMLIGAVLLHILVAVKHFVLDKENVFKRII